MGGGDFTQGLAGGIQNAMQMRQQAVDNQMRADYMKTQKKLLDMQWKAAEMEEQWWNQQPQNIRSLKFMPKEAQTIGMLMSGVMPLPGMTPSSGSGAPSPAPAPAPTMAAAQPAGLGGSPMALSAEGMPPQAQPQGAAPTGGGVVDIITLARNNPMLGGLLKKYYGGNPGEVNPRSIAGPEGRPITQYFDITGKPVQDLRYAEAVKPEAVKITGRKGEESTVYVDPYNPPKSMFTKAGQGKESLKSIYAANIKNIAIPTIDNLIKNSFTTDSKGNLKLTMSARVQGTSPKFSQQLGGEIGNDAIKLAMSLLRPESGAVINKDELMEKISAQLPKMFTSEKYAVQQFKAIGEVIDDYLSDIDPEYVPQARKIIEDRFSKIQGKGKPSLKLGGKAGAMTPEQEAEAYMRGQ